MITENTQTKGQFPRTKISVAIITKNEAHNLSRLIKSCARFDEVFVLDSNSTDGTCDIARSLGATVQIATWKGFGAQKQFAVTHCSNDWVLSLDADEELTPQLSKTIGELPLEDSAEAFELKRVNYFLGNRVRFSGWQDDFVIRLFHRGKAYYSDRLVHEKVVGFEKKTRLTRGHLNHYSYQSKEDVDRKVELYSDLGAKELLKKRKKCFGWMHTSIKTIFSLLRTLILKLGLLDGKTGWQISIMNARVTYRKCKKFDQLLVGHN